MRNVTGRDGYIIAKALHWALEHAQTLPEIDREWSDEEDMRTLLKTRFAPQNAMIEGIASASADANRQSLAATIKQTVEAFGLRPGGATA